MCNLLATQCDRSHNAFPTPSRPGFELLGPSFKENERFPEIKLKMKKKVRLPMPRRGAPALKNIALLEQKGPHVL
jgi:hypothetical protein